MNYTIKDVGIGDIFLSENNKYIIRRIKGNHIIISDVGSIQEIGEFGLHVIDKIIQKAKIINWKKYLNSTD